MLFEGGSDEASIRTHSVGCDHDRRIDDSPDRVLWIGHPDD